MRFGFALLARFRLFAATPTLPDAFELRLQRIGSRERRLDLRPYLFTALFLQPAVAAHS